MLAVFERLGIGTLEKVLGGMFEDTSLSLVRFRSQPVGVDSVPDARISGHFTYLFEIKTAPNALSDHQMRRHLARFDGRGDERLIAITPDTSEPACVEPIRRTDRRVQWASFATVSAAIDAVLAEAESVGGHERFLLRELQALIAADGLLGSPHDTVVVAARIAYPDYHRTHAYVCQARRSFRGVSHLAFYADGRIQPEVPKILEQRDTVEMSTENAAGLRRNGRRWDAEVAHAIEVWLSFSPVARPGDENKVVVLSGPAAPETVRLPAPIPNASTDRSGRTVAFTFGQRYTTLSALRAAHTTRDLDGTSG